MTDLATPLPRVARLLDHLGAPAGVPSERENGRAARWPSAAEAHGCGAAWQFARDGAVRR